MKEVEQVGVLTKATWRSNRKERLKSAFPRPVLILLPLANTETTLTPGQGLILLEQLLERDCSQT